MTIIVVRVTNYNDDNKNPIRINDVADVALAPSSNIPQIMRTNGKRTLLMQILHRDSANPIKVGHDIDKFVNVTLKKQLPDGISAQLIYNQGTYINKIIVFFFFKATNK